MKRAQQLLSETFGFDQFLPGQAEVIEHLLAGRSALAIFPTGGGKSLCYQLPALTFEGVTIVISPLIALMKNQIDVLKAVVFQPSGSIQRCRPMRLGLSC